MASNIFDLRSLGGEKRLLRQELPGIEEIPKSSDQWLTNEQIAAYLFFAHSNKSVIAKEVKLRPENGSLILYSKKNHSYKSDGYSWKRRKEGKVTREDHMRLKVKGVELIHANYVHSSLIPTFHRRAYCLLWSTDIILVHYLNTPSVGSQRGTEEKILNNLRQCAEATALGDGDILDQIEPMLYPRPGQCADVFNQLEKCRQPARISKKAARNQPFFINSSKTAKIIRISTRKRATKIRKSGYHPIKWILQPTRPLTSTVHNCYIYLTDNTAFREILNLRSWLESILNKWRNDDGATYRRNLFSTVPIISDSRKLTLTHSISFENNPSSASTSSVCFCKDNSKSDIIQPNCANVNVFTNVVNIGESQPSSSRPSDLNQYNDNIAIKSGQFFADDSAYCSINDCSSENNDNSDVLARSDATRTADPAIIEQNNDLFLGLSNYYDFDDLDSLTFPCLPNVNGEDGDLNQLVFSRREIDDLLESSKNCRPKQPANLCQSESVQYQSDNISTAENSSRIQSISSDSRQSYIPYFSSNNNLTITDFSPSWAYCDGGEKILITGENFKSDFQYECLFADQLIKAHYVQSGVLKCVCPPHDAQSISLFVHCVNDGALSSRLTFTYKNRQSNLDQTKVSQRNDHFVPKYVSQSYWLDGEETNFLRGLSERLNYLLTICKSVSGLQSMEDLDLFKSYASNNHNANLLEAGLLKVFSLISPKMLKRPDTASKRLNRQFPHHYGLTFAHLAARLGYDQLLAHFADYAATSSDFSFKNTDAFDRTPLVWSCLYNKIPSAVFLSKFSSESLLKNDLIHRKLPLSVSYERGYFDLLQKVTNEFARRSNNFVSEKDFDTAIWILTGGLVTHNNFLDKKGLERIEQHSTSLCDYPNLFDIGMNNDTACLSNSSDSDVSFEQECFLLETDSGDKHQHLEHANKRMQKANSAGQTDNVKIISFAQNIIEAFPRQNSRIGSHCNLANFADDDDDNDNESLALDNFPILPNFRSPSSARDRLSPANESKNRNMFKGSPPKLSSSSNDNVQDHVPLQRYSSSKISFASSNSPSTPDFRKTNSPPAGSSAMLRCSCVKMMKTSPPSRNGSLLSCCNEKRSTSDFDAFLNGLAPVRRVKSSLEFDFRRLSLSDREQRELYEAAKVIQNAFRQYKQRIQTRRQLEAEKHAATVIQSYYRRYKQFCYFKKVHRAAALIQKHFRTYKANKRKRSPDYGISSTNLPFNCRPPTVAVSNFSSSCTRNISNAKRTTSNSLSDCSSSGRILKHNSDFRNSIIDRTKNDHNYGRSAANSNFDNKRVVQVTADEMQIWKEQLAAIRIQHAFRGHAKRQAAARTIQRFMRRTKQGLRGTEHRTNIGSSTTNNTNLRHGYQSMPSSQ